MDRVGPQLLRALTRAALVVSFLVVAGSTSFAGPRAEFQARYPWVELLGNDAASWHRAQRTLSLADRMAYSGLVAIDDDVATVLLRAFDLMSHDAALAVHSLGLGRLTPDALADKVKGISGPGAGTLILSAQLLCDFPADRLPAADCKPAPLVPNVAARRGPITTLVHEAAHCLAGLIDAVALERADLWSAEAAAELAPKIRTTLGERPAQANDAFAALQRRAVADGVAPDYVGARADIAAGASTTYALGYGMSNGREDLATWVAQIVFPRSLTESRPYCDALAAVRAEPKRLTPVLATIIAKLEWLLDLGFIERRHLEQCTGGWPVVPPR